MKKIQQTHLAQSQDGEIYLTLDYLGKNNYLTPKELCNDKKTENGKEWKKREPDAII